MHPGDRVVGVGGYDTEADAGAFFSDRYLQPLWEGAFNQISCPPVCVGLIVLRQALAGDTRGEYHS
jgi:hypothetical protein